MEANLRSDEPVPPPRLAAAHRWRRYAVLGLAAGISAGVISPSTRHLQAQEPAAQASLEAAPATPPAVDQQGVAIEKQGDADDSRDAAMIRQLLRGRAGDPASIAQAVQATRQFDGQVAAEIFQDLADAHFDAGFLDLAAETRRLVVERFPDQSHAAQSTLWLLRLYASSEVAHARRQESAGNRDLNRQLAATTARETFDNSSDVAHAKADSALAAYAYHYSNQVTGARAALAGDPAIAFQRSVAARRAGHSKAAIGLLTPLKHRRAGDVWGDAARTEVWLGDRADRSPPRPTVSCRAAAAPPQLDGVLDEQIWQDAASARLGDVDPNAPHRLGAAEVRLAYDKEFLYLAVTCQKVAGVAYPRDEAPRPRDGDMANFDHVRLRLDLDRDYATCFELSLDSRGWTADACWGSAAWNPQWYVAAADSAETGGAWIVEAAIPWSELARSQPASGDAWACAIDRVAPGAGTQTWAGPPGEARAPQSFGLLLFD